MQRTASLTQQRAALSDWADDLVPVQRDVLTEADVWQSSGPLLWSSRRFNGVPNFYPVYRWGSYYSYSLLPLVLYKRRLRQNPRTRAAIESPGFRYCLPHEIIDLDVTRVGGPLRYRRSITSTGEYIRRIAGAVIEDIQSAETRHPGYTNIVLCGGKDSQNLLLLPWRNPVVVASAPPDHDGVAEFLERNRLPYELVELRDRVDEATYDQMILANGCQMNLEHCRWGSDLRQLAAQHDGRAIFWLGQLGDSLMAPKWKKYRVHPRYPAGRVRRLTERLGSRFQPVAETVGTPQRTYFKHLWYRGAMWQGVYMSVLRMLTGCLALSAYHGPAMRNVLASVDLSSSVQDDIRPLVGEQLRGAPVWYPAASQRLPTAASSRKESHVNGFLRLLESLGVQIV